MPKTDPAETASKRLPALAARRLDELSVAEHPLRILFFSKTKRHTRVPVHIIRGFRANGHHVRWMRTYRVYRLLGKTALALRYMQWRINAYRPDLIFVYGRDLPRPLLPAVEHIPIAAFFEDLPKDLDDPGDAHLQIYRQCRVLFTTARGLFPIFEDRGVPHTEYLHMGCDPIDHYLDRFDPNFSSEVAFIGQPVGDDRVRLLRQIHESFGLRIYGRVRTWQEAIGVTPVLGRVFPEQYRKICASAAVIIGIDLRNDIDGYFSNRTWLTLGCGGFLLTRYSPSLEDYFTNHQHLAWYRTPEECFDLIRYYLEHPTQREKIAHAGHEYVHTYHTFRHGTARVVEAIR